MFQVNFVAGQQLQSAFAGRCGIFLRDCDRFDEGVVRGSSSRIDGWTKWALALGISSGKSTGLVLGTEASCPHVITQINEEVPKRRVEHVK